MPAGRAMLTALGLGLFLAAYCVDAVLRLDPSLGRDPASTPLSFALFVIPAAVLLLAANGMRPGGRRRARK